MKKKNKIAKGFLVKYRIRGKQRVKYIPLDLGFLKLEYGFCEEADLLSLVSFVLQNSDDALAVGARLEMNLSRDGKNDIVTYITEYGVSGLQWSKGEVIWGHTYDDDTPASPGRKIGLELWIDEMIDHMINPPEDELEEWKRLDRK